MTRTLAVVVVVVVAGASLTARAQSVPVAPRSVAAQVGFESVGPPVVVVVAADRTLPWATVVPVVPFLEARLDLHTQSASAAGGLQLRHDVASWFFVREALSVGGFVGLVGNVAVGARAAFDVDAAFVVGDVIVFVGPVLSTAVTASDARLSVGAGGGVVVALADHVDVTGGAGGGYDFLGAGPAVGDGALRGAAFIGVRLRL